MQNDPRIRSRWFIMIPTPKFYIRSVPNLSSTVGSRQVASLHGIENIGPGLSRHVEDTRRTFFNAEDRMID